MHDTQRHGRAGWTCWRQALGDTSAVMLLGAVTRLWGFDRLGLNHFDEGGYALSSLAVSGGAIPEGFVRLQHFLSPPLFFSLSGLAMIPLGDTDLVPIGVSAVFGILTVGLVYAAGRYWFGRPAGLAAAVLLALSDFHILYSRAGLTDVTFTFLFLLAVVLYDLAEDRESFWVAVAAGLATGLAWNTKYHGWLALPVGVGIVTARLVVDQRGRWQNGAPRLTVAAVVAGLLYLPWFLYVHAQDGGYGRLVAEHSSYLRPEQSVQHLVSHLRSQLYLDGLMSRGAVLAASGIGMLALPRNEGVPRWKWLVAAALALVGGLAFGETVGVGVLALGGLAIVLAAPRERPWAPVGFFLLFTALTPMYRAYPRLLLPWLCAAALLAGAALASLLTPTGERAIDRMTSKVALGTAALFGVVGGVMLAVRGVEPIARTYRPSDGFGAASARIAEIVTDPEQPIAVLGEPAVAFYLKSMGHDAWHVNQPSEMYERARPGESLYLVGGVYSRRVRGRESLESWSRRHPTAFRELAQVPADVNDVRLLDDFSPEGATEYRERAGSDYELRVFQVTLPAR